MLDEPGACFVAARERALARLADTSLDKAPAGAVDAAAVGLVEAINGHASGAYVTTSTCAGRVALYATAGKQGRWLACSHEGLSGTDVAQAWDKSAPDERTSFRYEPPIAHVRCRTVEAAELLCRAAIDCGFRESGAVNLGAAAGPTAGIRTTGGALDCPLGPGVGDEYLEYVAGEASRRLKRDRMKLDALAAAVRALSFETDDETRAVAVAKASARRVKVALGDDFRNEFLITPLSDGEVAVPVTDAGYARALAGDVDGRALAEKVRLPRKKKKNRPSLRDAVRTWVESALGQTSSWAKLGDDARLVPSDFFPGLDDPAFWNAVAAAVGACRLFRDAEISPDGFRSSQRIMLRGDDPWVTIKENGLDFSFDATQTMFCFGNNSERLRHATFDCQGQTVVDLYAGIGYFTLPLLKAGASFVHACEWSPATANALRRNLRRNAFHDRCAIYEMDNALADIGPVAHRVSLGLTPTSRPGWLVACAVLRTDGALVHVHENVKDVAQHNNTVRDRFHDWGSRVAREFQDLLSTARSDVTAWTCVCLHVSRVKSYAPRVFHLVADIRCEPAFSSAASDDPVSPTHDRSDIPIRSARFPGTTSPPPSPE